MTRVTQCQDPNSHWYSNTNVKRRINDTQQSKNTTISSKQSQRTTTPHRAKVLHQCDVNHHHIQSQKTYNRFRGKSDFLSEKKQRTVQNVTSDTTSKNQQQHRDHLRSSAAATTTVTTTTTTNTTTPTTTTTITTTSKTISTPNKLTDLTNNVFINITITLVAISHNHPCSVLHPQYLDTTQTHE